jgi:hypothetical protein
MKGGKEKMSLQEKMERLYKQQQAQRQVQKRILVSGVSLTYKDIVRMNMQNKNILVV